MMDDGEGSLSSARPKFAGNVSSLPFSRSLRCMVSLYLRRLDDKFRLSRLGVQRLCLCQLALVVEGSG